MLPLWKQTVSLLYAVPCFLELGRGYSHVALELVAEIAQVVKARLKRYIQQLLVGCFDQCSCLCQTEMIYIFGNGLTCYFLKEAAQIDWAQAYYFRDGFYA